MASILNYIPDTIFLTSMICGCYYYPFNMSVVLLLGSVLCFNKEPNFMDRWAKKAELNRIKEELEEISDYINKHGLPSEEDEEEFSDEEYDENKDTELNEEEKLIQLVKEQYNKNEELRNLINKIKKEN